MKRSARVPTNLWTETGENRAITGTDKAYRTEAYLGGLSVDPWATVRPLASSSTPANIQLTLFSRFLSNSLKNSLYVMFLTDPSSLSSAAYMVVAGHPPYSIEGLAPAFRPYLRLPNQFCVVEQTIRIVPSGDRGRREQRREEERSSRWGGAVGGRRSGLGRAQLTCREKEKESELGSRGGRKRKGQVDPTSTRNFFKFFF